MAFVLPYLLLISSFMDMGANNLYLACSTIFCPSLSITAITKTCLYNFDSLKPHFYIVKLGFTGVYIIFLIFAQNIDCGYSLEPPQIEAVLTSTHNLCFQQKYDKYRIFLSENFHFLVVKFSIYLNRRVFIMETIP